MSEKIVLIGSGNVASYLGKAFTTAGHTISEVYSRNSTNAQSLASQFPNCKSTQSLDFSKSNASFFIFSISDDSLQELTSLLKVPQDAIVLHTSGTLSIEVLNKFTNHGVLYPIQTFTKGNELSDPRVPFCVEASNLSTQKLIASLVESISKDIYYYTSTQRKQLHLAAVFACNFTNRLYQIAESITIKEKIDFKILQPLVNETLRKAFEIGPKKAQTGPAIRGDEKIIRQHLDYLLNEPELYQVYQLFSQQIKEQKD